MKLLITYTLITILSFSNLALSQESAFDGTQNITVEEEAAAKTYVHQGKADKIYNEACSEGRAGFKDICTNSKDGNGGTLERMLPAVRTAYTMIVGLGGVTGGGGSAAKGASEGAAKTGADGAKSTSKGGGTDYCKYIPMAGEAYAMATTQMNTDKAKQNYQSAKPQAKQAASLYSLSKTHKDLAKTSNTQTGIWAAGGACYGIMMAKSGGMNTQSVLKMGGALLISMFYKKKADAHKKRAKAIQDIADSLPNAGECNPFTNTTCFCNEETSFGTDPGNFQKFCVPRPLVSRNKYNDASICVDDKGKPDVACGCKKKGKCIDKNLKIAALKFGLNPTVMKDPLDGIKPLSNGFGTGSIDAATNKNLARMKKALKGYNPAKLPTLTKSQKDLAKQYNELGIPKKAAIVMASGSKGNSSGKLPASFTSGISGNIEGLGSGDKTADKQPEKLNIRFNQGGKVRGKKKARSASPFAKFKKKRSHDGSGNVQIEDFAEKARREAEIIPDKQKIIFDIISYRYKVRAWREFETTFTKSDPKEKN